MKTIKERYKDLVSDLKTEIEITVEDLFKSCPELQTITWTQYVPTFNDGEPCVFGVNEIHFILNMSEALRAGLLAEAQNDNWQSPKRYAQYLEDLKEAEVFSTEEYCWPDSFDRSNFEAFEDLVYSNKSLMSEVYGDSNEITFTRGSTSPKVDFAYPDY